MVAVDPVCLLRLKEIDVWMVVVLDTARMQKRLRRAGFGVVRVGRLGACVQPYGFMLKRRVDCLVMLETDCSRAVR